MILGLGEIQGSSISDQKLFLWYPSIFIIFNVMFSSPGNHPSPIIQNKQTNNKIIIIIIIPFIIKASSPIVRPYWTGIGYKPSNDEKLDSKVYTKYERERERDYYLSLYYYYYYYWAYPTINAITDGVRTIKNVKWNRIIRCCLHT